MATFNGSEGAPIDRAEAAKWTANYRNAVASENGAAVKAHFYGREILQKLLDQPGAMGIRMYYARDGKSKKQLVLVAADADGNDMEDLVVDGSMICPPDCSTGGDLNG
ncbi:hypothetical protein ABID22_004061 [Pontibacter aydingkolensis]|uniref:Uncharacterized protein n=1 Tax=Pontibacter aydingkolensis TaxID=1911536 RepID=A0ABS7D0S8_9BACT|nr:hypothetical protein [Pontibacter aydingkolensis]MBW7469300.1 hypothetical protein [Pontibacter aydingkolensis]